jgi:hypothetical protein
MTDRTEFELEVVQRLTRIETKMDIQNGIVKKNCEDITNLEKSADKLGTQFSTVKKVLIVIGSGIGVLSTIVGIVLAFMRVI